MKYRPFTVRYSLISMLKSLNNVNLWRFWWKSWLRKVGSRKPIFLWLKCVDNPSNHLIWTFLDDLIYFDLILSCTCGDMTPTKYHHDPPKSSTSHLAGSRCGHIYLDIGTKKGRPATAQLTPPSVGRKALWSTFRPLAYFYCFFEY